MSRGLVDLIVQLEAEIEASPKPRLGGGNRRVVDCERILDLLGDIKVSIPDEIRQAAAVLAEKESIIASAQTQAAALLANARVKGERLVSREGVIEEARLRAENIVERAHHNADVIAQGARNYTDEILTDVQRYLQEYVDIIEKNRMELDTAYTPPKDQSASLTQPEETPQEDDGFESHFIDEEEEETDIEAADLVEELDEVIVAQA